MSTNGADLSERKQKLLPSFEKKFEGSGALDPSKLEVILSKACGHLSRTQIQQVFDAAIKAGVQTNEQFLSWLFGEAPCAAAKNGNGIAKSQAPCTDKQTVNGIVASKPQEDAPAAAEPPAVEKPPAAAAEPPAVEQPPAAASEQPAVAEPPPATATSSMAPSNAIAHASFSAQLQTLLNEHPYLQPGGSMWPHPMQYWVGRCRESIEACKFEDAQEYYHRVVVSLEADKKQIAEAFRRFDYNASGQIDTSEMRHMCAYLGWGEEEAALMDLDKDGKITLQEFQAFIGRLGGIQQLFAHRRLRISTSRRDVCDYAGIAVGARVRAHYYVHGHKSRSWREAQVLGVGIEKRPEGMGPATLGVLCEFVFGPASSKAKRRWRARQVVPPHWVLSSVEDASVAAALREVGILDDHQAFWALLLPETEMLAVERLESCQRAALKAVRDQASASHEQALPTIQERFSGLGYGERELQAVLSWIQDLAPVVVHVHLDRIGTFMEVDEFYRNQFETKTSCGALDDNNATRQRWEHDLFAGAYDGAKPFDRCKYGALNVMNDYRGVVSARQYGDSYLVLKDVRLRCTFASTDSGGISGRRLAVLDKYAHVLAEYSDEELKGLVAVAEAAHEAGQDASSMQPHLLRGSTEDATMEWVTFGFPKLQRDSGHFYFEVEVDEGSGAAQVGLLSSDFQCKPYVVSTSGVGDDEHGWAVDGQNAALWHRGESRAWEQSWPSQASPPQYYNPWSAPQQNTKPTRILSQSVVVGVAVDLGSRQVWFSSGGEWAQAPAFTADDIPAGVALYPAISIQGRASFNFGPDFTHPPEDAEKRQWPGAPRRKVRIDNPRLGNEETLRIYKEAQVHGELSLKRNVQRLVACRKYRDAPKTLRSWGLRVIGGARCAGSYQRAGAHDGMSLYRNASDAIIYWHKDSQRWRMSDAGPEDFSSWYCQVSGDGSREPPRRGWQVPDEQRGHLSTEVLRKALEAASVKPEEVEKLCVALSAPDSDGAARFFRVRGETSLEAEWERLSAPSMTSEEMWSWATAEMQRLIREEAGIPKEAVVIETSHPYAANRHKLQKEVSIEGVPGLVVHFHPKSSTLDRRARFRIFSGGLRRNDAGPGARLELACHAASGDKVWGTVVERSEGLWRVQLDRRRQAEDKEEKEKEITWSVGDKIEAHFTEYERWYEATIAEVRDGKTSEAKGYLVDWYDGDVRDREKRSDEIRPRSGTVGVECRDVDDLPIYAAIAKDGPCFAVCLEEPTTVVVDYAPNPSEADEQGYTPVVGDEIASFALDRSCPLAPFTIKSFSGPGPAQQQGVATGWFLDLITSVRQNPKLVDLFNGVGGATLDDPHNQINLLLEHLFNHMEEVLLRLNIGLRACSDVKIVFSDSACPVTPVLLPEARAFYGKDMKVGEEIAKVGIEKGMALVEGFNNKGPAHAAGVRTGWVLDWQKTVLINPRPPQPLPDKEAFDANPSVALSIPGITVAFKQPLVQSTQVYQASGPAGHSRWRSCIVPGDSADFEFSTDGDGGDQPEKRWGVFAVVLPKTAAHAVKEGTFTVTLDKSTGTPIGLEVQKVTRGESSFLIVMGTQEEKISGGGKCDSGSHDMILSDHDSSAYTSYICNGCGGSFEGSRWYCPKCSNDYCFTCRPKVREARRGLVHIWNESNPDRQVRSSDRFIEVNGAKDSAEEMLEQLKKDVVLNITVERSSGPMCNEGHMLQAMELPWNRCDLCGTYGTQYRCAEGCDYDLCSACHGQSQGGPLQPAGFCEFADKYITATETAVGVQGMPEVERDGWDLKRLHALCKRHGWEFEWMTEDGERRRRAHECQGRFHLVEAAHAKKLLMESDPAEPDSSEAAPEVSQTRLQELSSAEAQGAVTRVGTEVIGNEAAAETTIIDNEAGDTGSGRATGGRSSGIFGTSPRPAPNCVKFKNSSDADIKMVLSDSKGSREVWVLSGMSSTPIIRDWSENVTPSFNDQGKLPMTVQGGSVYIVKFEDGVVTCKPKE